MRRAPLPALAAALALAAVGCGGGSGYGSSGGGGDSGGTTVAVSASRSGELKFSPDKFQADSGTKTVTVELKNPSTVQHAIAYRDQKGAVVGKGGTSRITIKGLKDGNYELYCPVDGHKDAGMKATLVVGSGGAPGY